MEPIYGALAVVLVALVTGFVTWRASSRAKSGKIDTSEAATLWDEGTKMRLELRNEVTTLKAQLTEAITAITDLNREIKASRSETERAREETRLSRAETRRLMGQIEELHGEVKTSNRLTMGALADNIETRRILLLPKEDRTPVEFEHLASAGERLPEGEHPVIDSADLQDGVEMTEKEPLDE
jgi:hypothetical protein